MNYLKLLSLTLIITTFSLLSIKPVSGAELEEIITRGKLIVGIKDNTRPLGFYGADGQLQGLEIDLAKRLAEELLGDADAVTLQPISNQERLPAVIEGKVDLAIARVSQNPSRSRLVDFSHAYYLDGTGIVVKDPAVRSIIDLSDRPIAVLNGSDTIADLRSALPRVRLIGVNSYQEALALLEARGAAAFAADNSLLAGWVQQYPNYRQLPVRLSARFLCVVMPKGLQYVKLRERVDQAITRWQQSGWLRERATYWGLPLNIQE